MGRGVFISGLVLGILGLLWSFLLLFVLLALVALTFGSGAPLLMISFIAFLASIVGIVGGVIGRKRTVAGASVLLIAGVATIIGAALIFYSVAGEGTPVLNIFYFTFFAGWWAYGLLIAGILALASSRRQEGIPAP